MSMKAASRVPIAESQKQPLSGTTRLGVTDPSERLEVTLRLRSRQALPPAQEMGTREVRTRRHLTREEFASAYGADAHDIELVEAFAHDYELDVVEVGIGRRTVTLSGTAADMQAAFGTQLHLYEHAGRRYRGREGTVSVPEPLQGIVTGIFGLDNRSQARPHLRFNPLNDGAASGTFTPTQLAKVYDFPPNFDGSGQCIAIIELGGGFRSAELKTYFGQLGITRPPSVTAVSVSGGHNTPGKDPNADGEVLLDIEVAGAVAPGAQIAVYFAPNTDAGFLNAINAALHDAHRKPHIISISWGGPESAWTAQAMKAMDEAFQAAAAMGVTVLAAAGDDGSSDGVNDGLSHADFPASSPHVTACGGTRLTTSGSATTAESVWNEGANRGATGGGVSTVFALPTYQADAKVPPQHETKKPGRGLPDVSAVADPQTGYRVLVDGQAKIIGGTSAVAPLYAGLVALINQAKGKPVGFINPLLYLKGGQGFRDVVQGNNGVYSAGPGWDACTGWGSPDGVKLLGIL